MNTKVDVTFLLNMLMKTKMNHFHKYKDKVKFIFLVIVY